MDAEVVDLRYDAALLRARCRAPAPAAAPAGGREGATADAGAASARGARGDLAGASREELVERVRDAPFARRSAATSAAPGGMPPHTAMSALGISSPVAGRTAARRGPPAPVMLSPGMFPPAGRRLPLAASPPARSLRSDTPTLAPVRTSPPRHRFHPAAPRPPLLSVQRARAGGCGGGGGGALLLDHFGVKAVRLPRPRLYKGGSARRNWSGAAGSSVRACTRGRGEGVHYFWDPTLVAVASNA